jgi:hypothetical protein
MTESTATLDIVQDPTPELKQATLPLALEDLTTIIHMGIGREAYVPTYALWVDSKRLLWLKPHYQTSEKDGFMKMKIARKADGYHIWVPKKKTTWSVALEVADDHSDIPVAEIHY